MRYGAIVVVLSLCLVLTSSVGNQEAKAMPPLPVTYVTLGHFGITAYCPCKKCCGPRSRGLTKLETPALAERRVIAVDPRVIPLRTRVHIEGMGWYTAEDIGGKIKGKRVDVLMKTHWSAKKFGKKKKEVRCLER